jgi:hypothetical protein
MTLTYQEEAQVAEVVARDLVATLGWTTERTQPHPPDPGS